MSPRSLIKLRSDPNEHPFVHLPAGLDQRYLSAVVSRLLGQDTAVVDCMVTNLCADNWGGVSNSGATVLRLALTLSDDTTLDLVAKILSPDAVNLFKVDCRFGAREAEIAWARWWGEQDVPFAARVYDTRCDLAAREFWIIQEYFPTVGWDDVSVSGMKHFSATQSRLECLFSHAADIHAHSHNHLTELESRFPQSSPDEELAVLLDVLHDAAFRALVGLDDDACRRLAAQCRATEQRSEWVDDWDIVCVTDDLAPDNFGLRDGAQHQPVTFDWGTAQLGPMEQDIELLLRRTRGVSEETGNGSDSGDGTHLSATLLEHYLRRYWDLTGRHLDREAFRRRLPWARFLFHQHLMAEHVRALRWVPHQTRSKELIRHFVQMCEGTLGQLKTSV